MIGPFEAVILLAIVVVLGAIVVGIFHRVPDAEVESWASAHGLQLTPANRAPVARYLRNAHGCRTLGVMVGLFVASMPVVGHALGYMWLVVGYAAGAVIAELTRPRLAGGPAVASIVARDPAQYLPARLRTAQVVVAACVVVLAGTTYLTSWQNQPATYWDTSAILLGGGTVSALAIGLGLQRWVVSRPQRAGAPDLLAADDAMRVQAVHSIAGATLGFLFLLLASVLFVLSAATHPLGQIAPWCGIPCLIAAYVSVLYYGHRAWSVRRVTAAEVAA